MVAFETKDVSKATVGKMQAFKCSDIYCCYFERLLNAEIDGYQGINLFGTRTLMGKI